MKMSPSPSLEPPLISRQGNSIVIEDRDGNGPHCGDMMTRDVLTKENEAADKAMQEILDLLKTRVQKEDEQWYEADRKDEIKNDWTLAAAVFDRICAFAFAIILIGGTVVFFISIVNHAWVAQCSGQPAMYTS